MIIKLSKLDKLNNYFIYGGSHNQILEIKKNLRIRISNFTHIYHTQKYLGSYHQ